jgi:hypothetical protein
LKWRRMLMPSIVCTNPVTWHLTSICFLEFRKTNDSSNGPILNAMEIYKHVQITMGSQDGNQQPTFSYIYFIGLSWPCSQCIVEKNWFD